MYVSFPSGRSSSAAQDPGETTAAVTAAVTAPPVSLDHLTPNLVVNLEVLAADITEMEQQIFHLNRSNNELRVFLEQDPSEKEYQAAIFENVNVLAKKLEELNVLKALQSKIMTNPYSGETKQNFEEQASASEETPPEVGVFL